MTFMPVTCWKTESMMPIINSLTILPRNSSENRPSTPCATECSMALTSASASSQPLRRAIAFRAFSVSPFVTNQRGLSGTKNINSRKTTDGNTMTPIIHRQLFTPSKLIRKLLEINADACPVNTAS